MRKIQTHTFAVTVEKKENSRGPFINPNTARIGCATHIADKFLAYNANLYCQYSRNPDCYDENCCDESYPRFLDECKASVAAGQPFYSRVWQACIPNSFPNADHTIPANGVLPVASPARVYRLTAN